MNSIEGKEQVSFKSGSRDTKADDKAAGGVLTATQAPHRPGTAPAPGLRAEGCRRHPTADRHRMGGSTMLLHTVVNALRPRSRAASAHRRVAGRLTLEPLDERALPSGYVQENLASDVPGQAQVHDPELVDAWGLSINPNGTFWPSARATDVSTVYSGDVTPAAPSSRSSRGR
jgi:hypothetical protein